MKEPKLLMNDLSEFGQCVAETSVRTKLEAATKKLENEGKNSELHRMGAVVLKGATDAERFDYAVNVALRNRHFDKIFDGNPEAVEACRPKLPLNTPNTPDGLKGAARKR